MREKKGMLHVVVVNNLGDDKNVKNARFLQQLLRVLGTFTRKSKRKGGETFVRRISVVKCVRDLEELEDDDPVDRVILGGSYTHLHQLDPKDPRKLVFDRILARATSTEISRPTPVLGICFGAQLILDAYGGKLFEMDDLMCRTRRVRWSTQEEEKGCHATHMFCLKYLPVDVPSRSLLRVRATLSSGKDAGIPVAFSHVDAPLHGVLFHPEESKRSGSDGVSLLRGFVRSGDLVEPKTAG